MLNLHNLFQRSTVFNARLFIFRHLGTCSSKEVEMAIREWLRMQ